jgi:Concanavalin A-like lectin/glucanases superfamily
MNTRSRLFLLLVLAAPALFAQTSPSPAPIAHWSFDKLEKDTYPGIGKGAIPGAIVGPAVITGKVAAAAKGWKGGAVSFDERTPGFVRAPMDLSLLAAKGFTVEFWVRPTALTSLYGTCVDAGGNKGFVIRFNNKNCLSLSLGGVWNVMTTTERYTDPIWVHVALTFDTTTTRFYVNGVEVGNNPALNAAALNNGLYLGAVEERTKTPEGIITIDTVKTLNGDLDELKIYALALSAADVAKAAAAKPASAR